MERPSLTVTGPPRLASPLFWISVSLLVDGSSKTGLPAPTFSVEYESLIVV